MKWKELRHNGVAFPPTYEAKGLQINIRGETVRLSPDAEEMAYAWGKKRTTPYVQDPVFQANFLTDFVKVLPAKFGDAKYSEINFTPVYDYLSKEELLKSDKQLKKKVAAHRKELRLQLKEKYGYAVIDGTKTEFANYMVEPPGIFMGRGSHPMRGRWKPRIFPEDAVLNLSEDAPIPPGNWKEIVHDHESIWLAYWVDKLNQVRKYVWPSDISDLRQERDKMKYDNAKKLRRKFDFLGKDSVRWQKTLKVDGTDSPIRRNLQEFVSNKKPEDLVFDGITSAHVNRFLGKAARGLTAKVFRTHHATETVQTYLGRHNGFKPTESEFVKLYHARVANLEAAIRCNHKRTPPKTWEVSLDKKQQRLAELKKRRAKTDKQRERLAERIRKLKFDI